MSGMSRTKGTLWQRACRHTLETLGIHVTARQPGERGDDLVLGHPYDWISLEVKNASRLELAAWVDQARDQAKPGQLPVVWIHRRGAADPLGGYIVINAGDYWHDITGRTAP